MSTQTTKNVRFFLKHATEEEWNTQVDFVPGKGEAVFYSVDETHTAPRLKVGDGVTLLKDLPFVATGSIPGFDPDNIIAKKVEHKLTFGNGETYQYDGSADVTVPVYTGDYRA